MKVGALIVTFNPDINLLNKNIEAILPQVKEVIIVDNASKNIFDIEQLVSNKSVNLIKNTSNLGIAAALNTGFQFFVKNDFDFCLTLDQDSVCPANMIKTYLQVFNTYSKENKIGIICPAINYVGWSNQNNYSESVIPVKACMTSASFTSIEAWKTVCGFDESYYIDFVDNEFCKKLKLTEYEILKVTDVILEHNLGVCKEICILGKKIKYSLHSPLRYYYMIRNNIMYLKKYHKSENLIKEIIKVTYITVSALVFEKEKKQVLTYIRIGIKDAFHNRMGIYNHN